MTSLSYLKLKLGMPSGFLIQRLECWGIICLPTIWSPVFWTMSSSNHKQSLELTSTDVTSGQLNVDKARPANQKMTCRKCQWQEIQVKNWMPTFATHQATVYWPEDHQYPKRNKGRGLLDFAQSKFAQPSSPNLSSPNAVFAQCT